MKEIEHITTLIVALGSTATALALAANATVTAIHAVERAAKNIIQACKTRWTHQ